MQTKIFSKEKDRIRNQQINPVQNLTPQQKDYFRNGGGGQDSGNQSGNNQSAPSGPAPQRDYSTHSAYGL